MRTDHPEPAHMRTAHPESAHMQAGQANNTHSSTHSLLAELETLPTGSADSFVHVRVASGATGDSGFRVSLLHLRAALLTQPHLLKGRVDVQLQYSVRDLVAAEWLLFERVSTQDSAMWVCVRSDTGQAIKVVEAKMIVSTVGTGVHATPEDTFE